MRLFTGVLFLSIVLITSVVNTQELSTEVYPSEDELLEALRLGEITIRQYLILQEIITQGIDSTNQHLLDEIPNLSFFPTTPKSLTSTLEKEQQTSFQAPPTEARPAAASVSYQYYEELESERRSQYRITYRLSPIRDLEAELKVHREFSGRERIVGRRVSYRTPGRALREVVIGNVTRRFGAGTIVGYRGKLVDFADELGGESLLFPDYGGNNGAYVQAEFGAVEIQGLGSLVRDANHSLLTAGTIVSFPRTRLSPQVIVSLNRLRNRRTGENLYDVKYGWYSRCNYRDSYVSWELSGQAGERPSLGALVVEGRHLFDGAEVRYAGWIYSDDYLDLSGGSKAGNLSRTERIDKVDFSYSNRRSGQEGGLVKSIVLLADDVQMINSLLYAGR
ncbi:MAG: hypothetical protein AB1744_03925, partial [Candidatus Zixiibacteriota bacterium]